MLEDLGFHQMGKVLKRTYILDHFKELLEIKVFEDAYQATQNHVPRRFKRYFSDAHKGGAPADSSREAKFERGIWDEYGPNSKKAWKSFFKDDHVCILDYQFPLFAKRGKEGWGAIDLLGADKNDLPVVIELKSDVSQETPLRMLIESFAYGIAIRTLWNCPRSKLKTQFIQKIKVDNPPHLNRLSLILLAPENYWKGWEEWLIDGKPQPKARESFKRLSEMIEGKGFRIVLAKLNYYEKTKGVFSNFSAEKTKPWEDIKTSS